MTSHYYKNDELIFSRTVVSQTNCDIFDHFSTPQVDFYSLNPQRLPNNTSCICIPYPCDKLKEITQVIGKFERENFSASTSLREKYSMRVYELQSRSRAFVMVCGLFPSEFSETLQKTATLFKQSLLHANAIYVSQADSEGLGVLIPNSEKIFSFSGITSSVIDTTQNLSLEEQEKVLQEREYDRVSDETESESPAQE